MNLWVIVIATCIIVLLIEILSQKQRNNKNNQKNNQPQVDEEKELKNYPYKKKYILSKNEFYFYKQLQEVIEKYDLIIWAKVRIADIVEVDKNKINKNEYIKYFNKIQSKHIDFALINKKTLKLTAVIELDDNSHTESRDKFKDDLFKQVKIPLIRCKGVGIIEDELKKILPLPEAKSLGSRNADEDRNKSNDNSNPLL